MKDELFKESNPFGPEGFVFDARVSQVFDDMVNRSVPGYATIQLLVSDLAIKYAKNAAIYDLGCSTGNTILAISERVKQNNIKIVGVDNSNDMLEVASSKLLKHKHKFESLELEKQDLLNLNFTYGQPAVVILNLVLQFIEPSQRIALLKNIYNNLKPGGAMIVVEKTIQSDNSFNELFINYYHEYKREMGYSNMEVSQKREALENTLIPCTNEQNRALFELAGFNQTTTFFQWMNFVGYLCVK